MIRRRLRITGRVQGVCYRDWFVGEARALRLDGWVRNRADGSVEALVQGTGAIVQRARQGSPASRVDAVAAEDDASTETPSGFGKCPTV